MMADFNNEIEFLSSYPWACGLDEVGRGPLAGPVVSACALVILEDETLGFAPVCAYLNSLGIDDSKKLSHQRRQKVLQNLGIQEQKLYQKIEMNRSNIKTLILSVAEVSPALIDEMNILHASWRAMENAFQMIQDQEQLVPQGMILVDGPYLPKSLPSHLSQKPLVKGDSRSKLIALSSIVAKEYRDGLMVKLDRTYPGYGFAKHSGYPTKAHCESLKRLGACPEHRRSFKTVKNLGEGRG